MLPESPSYEIDCRHNISRRPILIGAAQGSKLHYETRVDGEAVDPQKFLRAGVRLGGLI